MGLLWVTVAAVRPGASDAFGAGDIHALTSGMPKAPIPWEQATRLKNRGDYDKDLVRHAIQHPEQHFDEVDPRDLHGTQPEITNAGLHYYMHERGNSEETYADKGNIGNRHPVVYTRDPNPLNPRQGQQHVLLSGHHRAAAALLKGEPLRCVHVHGPWGDPR
jgi:hypothetical protein